MCGSSHARTVSPFFILQRRSISGHALSCAFGGPDQSLYGVFWNGSSSMGVLVLDLFLLPCLCERLLPKSHSLSALAPHLQTCHALSIPLLTVLLLLLALTPVLLCHFHSLFSLAPPGLCWLLCFPLAYSLCLCPFAQGSPPQAMSHPH